MLSKNHQYAIISAVIILSCFLLFWLIPTQDEKSVQSNQAVPAPPQVSTAPAKPQPEPAQPVTTPPVVVQPYTQVDYVVQHHDTLSSIFKRFAISPNDMHQLLEVDADNLTLDNLKPGDVIGMQIEAKTQKLIAFELNSNPRETLRFSRTDDGAFEVTIKTHPITPIKTVNSGVIESSFALAAKQSGLNANDITQLTFILKNRINFNRDLHKGDKFTILSEQHIVKGRALNQRKILAIKIEMKKKTVELYLNKDGHYYSRAEEIVHNAFLSRPTDKIWRISSHFSPYRRHPVTGRRQPHNGVDFAAPSGTPVLSVGDGIVVQTVKHPYAGRYVVIKHNGKYKTRYLHNSKILVKKGQHVKKGQVIALSGQSGRVTGPHIHFELLAHDKPVNPLKAVIPVVTKKSVPNHQEFNALVRRYKQLINQLQSLS